MHRSALLGSVLFVALARSAQAAPPAADPLAAWLSSEGLAPAALDRDPAHGWVNDPRTTAHHHSAGDRLALVRSFAQRAGAVEGLPPLDTVDLEPPVRHRDAPLLKTFRRLTLRLADPPLDGLCIDPRVEVGIYDEPLDGGGYALPRATSLTVRCEREPTAGNKPPADTARILPRAAAGTLPFVAHCSLGTGKAMVIDRRGDIYEYESRLAPTTAHLLAVEVRRGKHFSGSLTPAALDRLVALVPFVASAPRASKAIDECALLRAGANDALVRVSIDKHLGAAAEEARHIVHRDASTN